MKTQQGFPNSAGPWVNPDGTPTQPFIQLIIALWNRTGGARGASIEDALILEALLSAQHPVPVQPIDPATFRAIPAPAPPVDFNLPPLPMPSACNVTDAELFSIALSFSLRGNANLPATVEAYNTVAHTWTATQTFAVASGGISVEIDGLTSTNRRMVFSTSASARWQIFANNTAEGGANAGSDFAIARFDDAGAFIDNPLLITRSTGLITIQTGLANAGQLGASSPQTKTIAYSVLTADYSLIFNGVGSITVTLPSASANPGRFLLLKTIANQAVVSASSNVVPISTAVAGTAILAATAGKWALLHSDGSNWITMMAN